MKVLRALSVATLLIVGMDCQRGADANNPGSAVGGATGGSMAGEAGSAAAAAGSASAGAGGMVSGGGGGGAQGGQAGGAGVGGGGGAGSGGYGAASVVDAAADGARDAVGDAQAGPVFSAVLAIFKERCTFCHAAGVIVAGLPKLHLTADVAYRSLVGVAAEQTCGGILVVPSDSARSYLVHKLVDATPCDGVRMPMAPELGTFMPLSDGDVTTIRNWIDQGAPP